ncbi:Sensory transduction histidine kinase [Lachnospiraceae bacterium TWA4]|nr:Sensory transduction histidine kinase [Lachnospiraceae bacterium TWA4]
MSLSWFLNLGYAIYFYKEILIMRFFWGSMYSVICLVSEYITFWIPKTFAKVSSLELLAGGSARVLATLIYITSIFIFVLLFRHTFTKHLRFSFFQDICCIFIFVSGIGISHFILILILEVDEQFNNSSFTNQLILVDFMFIALFLALIIYIYQLGYSKMQNIQLLEQSKLYELEDKEYQNLLKTAQSLREIKHDVKIHLGVIKRLVEQKNYMELEDYIQTYNQSIETHTHLPSTGNLAIDCVLSNSLQLSDQLKIKTSYSVMLPSNLPIDNLSLASLLGNLWNNAIEACTRLINEKNENIPFIQFYMKPFQNMVIIHIENSYDGILLADDTHQSFLSLKQKNHYGIGLQRIKQIINELDGILHIETENYLFSVHIMIPLKTEEGDINDFNNHSCGE